MARYLRLTIALALCGVALVLAVLARQAVQSSTLLVPTEGGTYTEAVVGFPQWLNPALAPFNEVDQDLCQLLFRGLTRVDEHLRIVPDLAESWEATGDGLTYTFTLRQDVKWQDGAPVVADDVVYTFRLMQSSDYPGPPYLQSLWKKVQIEKIGDRQVRFTLDEPYAPFLDYTTTGLLPSHVLGNVAPAQLLGHPFNSAPLGNGPFILEAISNDEAVLLPNPNYEGPRPLLEKLVLRFYSNIPSAFEAYRAGEVNGIREIPPEFLDQAAELRTLNLYSASKAEAVWLLLNTKAPPLDDAQVRRALSLAVDRAQVIEKALYGQGLPLYGPLLPSSWAYSSAVAAQGRSLEGARALLDEAGWTDGDGDGIRDKDGQRLSLQIVAPESPLFQRVVEEVAAQWKEIGVDAAPVMASQGDLAEAYLRPRDYQAALYYWISITPDPDLYPFFHSTQASDPGQNFTSFTNRDADEIMEAARQSVDMVQRQDLYARLQEILVDEAPVVPLYQPMYTMGISDEVQAVTLGPVFTPSDRFRSVADWYMITRRVVASQVEEPASSGQ